MKPVLVTYTARSMAAEFRERYGQFFATNPLQMDMMRKLDALPDEATIEQVNAITENPDWFLGSLAMKCSGCDQYRPRLVRVGEGPDYESATAWLCVECLKDAADLLASHA